MSKSSSSSSLEDAEELTAAAASVGGACVSALDGAVSSRGRALTSGGGA
ncbi:hypothetical protein LY474_05915 [Myxococcus stipitatus]|nr:hypothetical protein [Myxococcus stipitatus]MCE9667346.1 hypothetical protein [Myxococcus stipitatus]